MTRGLFFPALVLTVSALFAADPGAVRIAHIQEGISSDADAPIQIAVSRADEKPFVRATPESQGLSSRDVLRWVDSLDRRGGCQSFVLLRHGKTLAEGWWRPFETNGTHLLYSVSKSFTSTAVGLLVDEGRLDLDERVAEIFPDKLPDAPSLRLLSLRVRDLLTMTTGHTNDAYRTLCATGDGDWVKTFLGLPLPQDPGASFQYETAATYMLSAIVRRKTGERMSDYLQPRLFEPLGVGRPVWDKSPSGDDLGGTGLYLTTRALASFGQLWLQEGTWRGRQLLSRDYVRLASSKQTRNGLVRFEGQRVREDWSAGYGFQFWRCRHNAFRAAGAYGQFVIVMPDQDAVVAINSNASMQETLEDVWNFLLAGMKSAPLAPDEVAAAALRARTDALATPPVAGTAGGAPCGRYRGEKTDFALSLAPAVDGCTLTFSNAAWQVASSVGFGAWGRGRATFAATHAIGLRLSGTHEVAASGARQADGSFRMRILLLQTPHAVDFVLRPAAHGAWTAEFVSPVFMNPAVPEERLCGAVEN